MLEGQSLELLEALRRNVKKVNCITEELLLLATMNKKDVPMEPVDMGDVINNALSRLQTMVDSSQSKIVLPKEWPLAMGYSPWIEEVWMNYISNAIKYGGQPPQIIMGTDSPSKGMVRFWIQDNGSGILVENIDDLFAPAIRFQQIDTRGYGLGLSIVRQIVEKLGGEVGVQSAVGKGSIFSFTLLESLI
jgi:signal transduction histidine kinase